MEIIELNEKQFQSYAQSHSKRNYFQTTEYSNFQKNYGYDCLYLGLIDNNNLLAASLILFKNIKGKKKYGIVPGGYLIDYTNFNFLKAFTELLKIYLKKLNFIFIQLEVLEPINILDKNHKQIKDNKIIIDNLNNLKYEKISEKTDFNKYNIILNTKLNSADLYKTFNRNTKRNITKSSLMGISIHKGNNDEIESFYSLIQKKDKNNISYYKNLANSFNNMFEIYFSKLNPNIYINNYRYLLKQEEEKNFYLNNIIQDTRIKKNNKIITKKMNSDKLIIKYKKEIVEATEILTNYPNGIILGTCAIIKNNREIYFIVDGYEERLRKIHSSHMLKWEIIKKYLNEGYKLFNLGEISNNLSKDKNKYYGLYLSKIGFNGKIYENPHKYDLIISPLLYKIYAKKIKR